MIRSLDYNHKLYEIAKEGKFGGKFEIKKIEDPGGEILQCYDSLEGRVYSGELLDPYKGVELYIDGGLTMTDSPLEQDSYQPAVDLARKEVLVGGLGLGLFIVMVEDKLKSGEISGLDVVETDRLLIDWVGDYLKPHYPMINIIEGDAWKYPDIITKRYDLVFIDIWQGVVCALAEGPEISKLYTNLLARDGKVLYWMEKIRDKMGSERGLPNPSSEGCPICDRVSNTCTSMLYKCLCMECTNEYEHHRSKIDPRFCFINSLREMEEEWPEGRCERVEENISNMRLASKFQAFYPNYTFDRRVVGEIGRRRPDGSFSSEQVRIKLEGKKVLNSEEEQKLEDATRDYLGEKGSENVEFYYPIYNHYDSEPLRNFWDFLTLNVPGRFCLACWDVTRDRYTFVTDRNIERLCRDRVRLK